MKFDLLLLLVCVFRIAQRLLGAAWQQGSWRAHHTPGTSLKYIPRRAVLYVPGNDERKLRKLTSLNVDCAVLDCEDGVALNKKVNPPVIIPTSPDSMAHPDLLQSTHPPTFTLHSARCLLLIMKHKAS